MTRTKISLVALGVLLLAGAFAPRLESGQAQKSRKQPEPYAIIGGTVFTESGQPLPGAKVVLSTKEPPKNLQDQMSSPRGEFAFRVPPASGVYVISATLKGYDPASKEVEIVGQEQLHKTLLLSPSSK